LAAEAAQAEESDPEQIDPAMTVSRAVEKPPTPFGEALRRFFIDDQVSAGPGWPHRLLVDPASGRLVALW
jgi:hypothetical protein